MAITLDGTNGITAPDVEVLDTDGATLLLNRNDSDVAAGDLLGQVAFYDADGGGTGPGIAASVASYAESAFGASSLRFSTSQSSGGNRLALTEHMRVDNLGNLRFNSGYGSVATAYGCRAWVNFNGTGTVAIRASGNVSSITDNGTGDYTVNFTTAMPDANYSIVGMTGPQPAVSLNVGMTLSSDAFTPTTSAARVQTRRRDTNGDVDVSYALVSVFR
jgi:hypothetical protein